MSENILFVRLAAAVLATLLLAGCAPKDGETVVVATDATRPPMEMVDEKKKIVGFDIDLMEAIARKGGFEAEFRNTERNAMFVGLLLGTYDAVISSVSITEDRKKTMDFSDPYINAGQVLVVQKDTQDVAEIADLRGESVGAQIGTTGAVEIQKVSGVTLKTYDDLGFAMQDLAAGRIAGVVCDTPAAADFALRNESCKDELKIVGQPFTEELYGIAVRKGNKELLDKINAGLAAVKKAGTIEKLEKKWLR